MLHWDDELERRIQQELARKHWEESPLRARLRELELEVFHLRQQLGYLKKENQELRDQLQALLVGQAFPKEAWAEVKGTLEEAWLELVLMASPRAEALSGIIRRLERFLLDQNPR
ncbi:hypothetical protein TCCBUS3UF1_14490 [Thermus sp. CCB_US3_UF1]|uniref:hypothetical protein n=1 Tax=unclassified Thermus TaxID=2619321 RepID=UPI00023891E4|nr:MULTISPECIES: hypothetical protein [unclassified Thermus]AEV16490.1 hypothetical protein TCCBUS3UF1_14490 [Thermus sp. CCB_US3_UF1]MCX7849416.1 hypothetical protein [Thermus sp.]